MDYNDHDYNANYQADRFNRNRETKHSWDTGEVTLGTWIVVLLLLAIPILNIIVLLVLAFGDHNVNLQNFAKATLILMIVGFVLAILLGGCSF